MSEPKEHISNIRDEIEAFHAHGHAKEVNIWAAINNIELGLHDLEKAIEYQLGNGEKNGRKGIE